MTFTEEIKTRIAAQDEEIANLHALYQDARSHAEALEAAMQTILHTIDPGGTLRQMIASDLEERSARQQRMAETTGDTYDAEGCAFGQLATRILMPPR